MPELWPCMTLIQNIAAMAASTAAPPLFSISVPISEHSETDVATAPWGGT